MKEVYVLMSDGDGTTRSQPEPFGVAVTSEEEAIKFKNSNFSYFDTFTKIKVFDTLQEAMEYWGTKC